jgi:protein required for attachment to host cells
MEQLVRERKAKALIVVAPPRTLGDLRRAFHADVKERIVAEIDKDLTKQSTRSRSISWANGLTWLVVEPLGQS